MSKIESEALGSGSLGGDRKSRLKIKKLEKSAPSLLPKRLSLSATSRTLQI